jgi:hypothetical protein
MPPGNSHLFAQKNAFSSGVFARPCIATLYYEGYVSTKEIFYCPGLRGSNVGGNQTAYTTPDKGWPDGDYLKMGYLWIGGSNWTSNGTWSNGHRILSLTKQLLNNPCYTASIKDPTKVSPLIDILHEDTLSDENWKMAHGIGRKPTGSNHWYIDGHVSWWNTSSLLYSGYGGHTKFYLMNEVL